MASIQAVNQSLNGLLASESTSKVGEIPRAIAASISGMSIAILETMHEIEAARPAERELLSGLRRLMWKIDCGWNAVLAGDIDDIEEHVQLEGAAREVL